MMRLDRMIHNPQVNQVQAEEAKQMFNYLGEKIKKVFTFFKVKKEQRRTAKAIKLVKSIGAVKHGDTEMKSAQEIHNLKAFKKGALLLLHNDTVVS